MRYGQSHLEHVYHSQLKNRCQKNNESLQEFEADIARLVRLAYSSTPKNVMERLAVQAFLDGLRDTETRQSLILARPSKLLDALARALEFDTAKQSSRGQAKVDKMEEDVEERTCNEAEIRRGAEDIRRLLDKRPIRCWNGAKFCCTPGDDMAVEDYVSTVRQRMDDIHERVRSSIQGASNSMKETYDINANDGRYQPGNQIWSYNSQRRGLSPKLQSSWEVPYEVVHFNRLAPSPETMTNKLEARVRHQEKERFAFYLATKQLSHHKPTYQNVWDTLVGLRDVLLSQNISSLAIPKIASELDGLDWRVIRSMLEASPTRVLLPLQLSVGQAPGIKCKNTMLSVSVAKAAVLRTSEKAVDRHRCCEVQH
ncbi:hypothetical protein NQ318_013195 [Aromia moschata]|uniref:Retrotransposon gag domain-containing protein n=1 Tax=Aromia moschata TaxID=1265417 RepID=A0AAV8X169_9CUCU|nr:hypothetical protein NQ318_013195 [Aromia moschata]